MMNIFPIVLFCAIVPGEPLTCEPTTAIIRHDLDPVSTPAECMIAGATDAAKSVSDFEEQHPNKKLQFRVLCKMGDKT